MIDSNERLQARLHALRSEFDQSFARVRQPPQVAGTDYLLIRVAGEPYALRLGEVSALEADRAITPVPSEAPALLHRWLVAYVVVVVILLIAVWDMVVKPGL